MADGQIQWDNDSVLMEDAAMLPGNELLYMHNDGVSLTLWSVALDPEIGAFRSPPRLLHEVHTRNLTAAANGTLAGVVVNLSPRVVVGTLSNGPLRLEGVHELASDFSSAYPHSWSADSDTLYFEQLQDDHWRIMSQSLLSSSPVSRANSKLD